MDLTDEKIIRLRRIEKRKRFNNINTGMYAGEEFVTFQESLYPIKMSVFLPENFRDMETDMMKKKYPFETRPQVIITNDSGDINFTFSKFNQLILEEQMEMTLYEFRLMIKAMQPQNQFFESGNFQLESTICYWCDFKSNAFDGETYNVLAIIKEKNGFFLAMLNCPYDKVSKWKGIMLEVLKSVREVDYESNDNRD